MVGIVMIMKRKIAYALPCVVNTIAGNPSPFFRNLCPGRIPSSVSVSGHPKKIEGMKSRKVCVIAIAVMNVIMKIGFMV